jgi:hypothetical protein
MDDLKDRLQRYSDGFGWESGAVHRMFRRADRIHRRRRLVATTVATVIGVLGVAAALRAFGDTSVPLHRPPETSAPVGNVIPEGVYWTAPMRRSDVMRVVARAGVGRHDAREFFFSKALPFDPVIREGLIIQDRFWVQTAENGAGEQETGWTGTFEVLNGHRIAATGYGCTITYQYELVGDTLSLQVLNETGPSRECGRGDIVAQTAIFNPAPFVREVASTTGG